MGSKKSIPGQSGLPAAAWAAGLHLMNAVAVSSTNTYHSAAFNAGALDNIGLQVSFGGTATMVGTLTVECSVDNSNWIALTFNPSLAQPSGAALSYLVNLNQVPFPYVRVTYVNASGAGTLDVYLSAKDLN